MQTPSAVRLVARPRSGVRWLLLAFAVGAGGCRPSPSAPVDAGPDLARDPAAALTTGATVSVERTSHLVAGDWNGDGRLDLVVNAVSGLSGSSLVPLIGRGDGTFATGTASPLGVVYCEALAAADLDSDGKLDLVVASATRGAGPDEVVLFPGRGDASFDKPRRYPVALRPVALAVGDFNRDRAVDVAAATRSGGDVSILLGDGKGGLGMATHVAVGRTPNGLSLADLDRDGKSDLLVALEGDLGRAARDGSPVPGSGLAVLLGRGDGGFAPPVFYSGGSAPNAVVVGDFNGDQIPDVGLNELRPLMEGLATGGVWLLLGKGDGSLDPRPGIATGLPPYSLSTADLDGDGRADLLGGVPDFSGGELHWVKVMSGRGDGTFVRTAIASLALPGEIAVGDFNRDQRLDLAVVTLPVAPSAGVTIYLGRP